MNVDDLRNRATREIVAKRLMEMKIGIATIQETHWVNNGEWEEGEYTFYVTTARKNGTETKEETKKAGNQK